MAACKTFHIAVKFISVESLALPSREWHFQHFGHDAISCHEHCKTCFNSLVRAATDVMAVVNRVSFPRAVKDKLQWRCLQAWDPVGQCLQGCPKQSGKHPWDCLMGQAQLDLLQDSPRRGCPSPRALWDWPQVGRLAQPNGRAHWDCRRAWGKAAWVCPMSLALRICR